MVQYQYEPKHSEANHSLEEKKKHLYEEKSATKKSCGLLEISSCIATLFDKKIWPLFFFLMLLALSKALKLVHTESLKQCQTN